jgi:hypothetical protein
VANNASEVRALDIDPSKRSAFDRPTRAVVVGVMGTAAYWLAVLLVACAVLMIVG